MMCRSISAGATEKYEATVVLRWCDDWPDQYLSTHIHAYTHTHTHVLFLASPKGFEGREESMGTTQSHYLM